MKVSLRKWSLREEQRLGILPKPQQTRDGLKAANFRFRYLYNRTAAHGFHYR
jgi:hypothetical protein